MPSPRFSPRLGIGAGVLLALAALPAPLLPPSGLAAAVQSSFGVGDRPAYLVAAILLHVAVYGSLGVAAALAAGPGSDRRGFFLRLALLPPMVVALALLVRSLRLGYVPVIENAIVPLGACAAGALLGLAAAHYGWRGGVVAGIAVTAVLFFAVRPGAPRELRRETQDALARLAAAAKGKRAGDERFGALLRAALQAPDAEDRRAGILALGIAVGHERLARYAGMERGAPEVAAAAALRAGTTLRGREDWARHYCVSAALAAMQSPFWSDVAGSLKENVDALAHGSGFSFADLAADRAGVRLAERVAGSPTAAQQVRALLEPQFRVDEFFPDVSDLAEGLTPEQVRREYGGVGGRRYREVAREIERRLDRCAALSP